MREKLALWIAPWLVRPEDVRRRRVACIQERDSLTRALESARSRIQALESTITEQDVNITYLQRAAGHHQTLPDRTEIVQ